MRQLVIGLGRLGGTLVRSFGKGVAGVVTSRPREGRVLFPEVDIPFYARVEDVPFGEFDLVWLAVPDRAITALAERLAALRDDWNGITVVHASGATSLAPLVPLRERGAAVAALHPNAILGGDEPFADGLVWGITSDGFPREDAERLLAPFRPQVIEISDDARPLYHAAASVAANYSMVIFEAARRLYRQAGVPAEQAADIVARFMREAVRVSLLQGFADGLTGPVARGDAATIEEHRAAIRRDAPELYDLVDELVRTATHMIEQERGKEQVPDNDYKPKAL